MPQGWIQTPRPNTTPNTNPGPPVSWNDPSNPDAPQAGYGYIPNDTTKEETFFYHSDHLGSTSYITDVKANITQFDAYLPYGELLVDEHSSSEELPYKFNGKQFDEETGLYYYGARYMNPMASIWYGMDPLSEKYPYIGGVVYCEGNPVVQIDDFGLAPKKPKRKVNNNSNQFNPLNAPTYEIGGIIYRGGQMVGEKPLEPNYTIETLLIGGLSSVRVGSIARSTFSRIKNLFSGGSGKVSKRGSLRPTLSKKNQNINQNGSLGSSLPIFKKWLKGVDRLDRDQIVRDLRRLGFKKVYDGKGMIHMERGGIKIRLDPPQHGTEYNHMHCLAIEGDGTAAVARSGDDLELVVAELDDLFIFEESANRRKLVIELHLIEGFCLLGESLHQVFISCRYFRFQSELLIDGVVAEVMVKMAMGYEQVNGLELVLLNILSNSRALFWIKGAAIDDDAFLGLIAHHVAVFLQHVYLKSFYM